MGEVWGRRARFDPKPSQVGEMDRKEEKWVKQNIFVRSVT